MDLTFALKALIMGMVEGFTEFLPISSTGHLILVGSLLDFTGAKIKVFEVAIQVGALLAVCWEYRRRIVDVSAGLANDIKSQQFALNVLIGFFPAAILGFFFIRTIQEILFSPAIVASAFIVGGFLILWVERGIRRGSIVTRVETIDDMNALDALKVGLVQAIALIPGTSRSGATIIGGMWLGLSRKASTEYSFFLAMPTLMGAAVYSVYTDWALLSVADLPLFTVGTVAAFVSGFLCVRWLLRYIGTHDYTAFGWYRIAFGLVILITATTGTVDWTH